MTSSQPGQIPVAKIIAASLSATTQSLDHPIKTVSDAIVKARRHRNPPPVERVRARTRLQIGVVGRPKRVSKTRAVRDLINQADLRATRPPRGVRALIRALR